MNANRYVETNPRVCNGRPVLVGTRIPVAVLLDQTDDGAGFDDLHAPRLKKLWPLPV
jgi:uncharacterized protein (DUF433 family)